MVWSLGLALTCRSRPPDGLALSHRDPGAHGPPQKVNVLLVPQLVLLVTERLVKVPLELLNRKVATADLREGLVGYPMPSLAVVLALRKVPLLAGLRGKHCQNLRTKLPGRELRQHGVVRVAPAGAGADPLGHGVGLLVGHPLRRVEARGARGRIPVEGEVDLPNRDRRPVLLHALLESLRLRQQAVLDFLLVLGVGDDHRCLVAVWQPQAIPCVDSRAVKNQLPTVRLVKIDQPSLAFLQVGAVCHCFLAEQAKGDMPNNRSTVRVDYQLWPHQVEGRL
mmetsp:Transcript_129037/g.413426  ORF Transcript_129037/g.413426 Transcript_129037/m.413426 type:complete len:280 (+) Transcript_129037:280-1119(+)